MTISRVLQRLLYANTVFFSSGLHAFAAPPPATCVALPEETAEFDQVLEEHVKNWMPSLQYVVNTQHLSIKPGVPGEMAIRQRFIPSSEGSVQVSAAAVITPAVTYELKQSILFESGFDWGGIYETGKIGFGLGGGSSPSGGSTDTDGFTARLIWEGNADGTAQLGTYVYSADRSHNLPYGDVFLIDDFNIPIGEWINVTMTVTTNSSLEEADGTLTVWINDEVKLEREGIHWQSSGEQPMVDSITLASFYGGNTSDWSPERTTHAKISNICYTKG